MIRASIVALVVTCSSVASAHKPSVSHLELRAEGAAIHARWDLSLRDLDERLRLDRDGNGQITWAETRVRQADIQALALAHLQLSTPDGACRAVAGELRASKRSDGGYAVLLFRANCAAPVVTLDLAYSLFFDHDAHHRGVASITLGGRMTRRILTTRLRAARVP